MSESCNTQPKKEMSKGKECLWMVALFIGLTIISFTFVWTMDGIYKSSHIDVFSKISYMFEVIGSICLSGAGLFWFGYMVTIFAD